MIAILILAGVGVILNFLGRWLVVQEDEGLRRLSRWAVMLLPGAELLYVVLRWEHAKTGSVVCALSLGFALPLAGQFSVLAGNARKANGDSSVQTAWKLAINGEARRQQQEQQRAQRETVIERKKEKLGELAKYVNQWYDLLEQRRGTLGEQAETEVTVFNRDAAAYHGLLKASKSEMFELKRLVELHRE
jgi:hypothetical protein